MANTKTQALIKITKIGDKANKFWIKDEKGEFYSGFKDYQGTQNQEYSELLMGNHGGPFKEGDMATIVYTKTAGTGKNMAKT
jgi:hypothetical protein